MTPSVVTVLVAWPLRRWVVALAVGAAFALVVAVPTDLVDTPVFSRAIAPPWWAAPSLLVSSALAGLVVATYVGSPAQADRVAPRRGGWLGAALTYLAVGCPVCNKLALLALGSAGAVTWFEPVQPLLQVVAVAALAWALRTRLLGEVSCPTATTGGDVTRA